MTNLTSDVDGVKVFVSTAIATIISSIFLILGSSVLLLSINWRLGLSVLIIVPFIGIVFYLALKKVRELFKKGQEAIDWLNRVINDPLRVGAHRRPGARAGAACRHGDHEFERATCSIPIGPSCTICADPARDGAKSIALPLAESGISQGFCRSRRRPDFGEPKPQFTGI